MPEKPAKPAASKLASSRTPDTRGRQPDQDEIATRAYFMYLAQKAKGISSQNWLSGGARADDGLRAAQLD